MRSSIWLAALVVFVGLGIGGEAQAGAKMDWSEFLEPPGARPPRQVTPTATQRPAKAEKASKKVSKAAAKKASRARAKKAKRSARNNRRR